MCTVFFFFIVFMISLLQTHTLFHKLYLFVMVYGMFMYIVIRIGWFLLFFIPPTVLPFGLNIQKFVHDLLVKESFFYNSFVIVVWMPHRLNSKNSLSENVLTHMITYLYIHLDRFLFVKLNNLFPCYLLYNTCTVQGVNNSVSEDGS